MQRREDYSISELIQNPSFCRMAQGTANADEVRRWNAWIEAHDKNREKAREAITEIVGFKLQDPAHLDMEEEWSRLYEITIGKPDPKLLHMPARHSSLKWIYEAVAILILGGIVGLALYMYPKSDRVLVPEEQISQTETIKTGTDEKKTIKFSNGSRIIMNSNSAVTYSRGQFHDLPIKVTLKGEAYFDAESNNMDKESVFEVQTPGGIIRDIGTKFMVSVQGGQSKIILQKGEVKVSWKHKKDSMNTLMRKGELIEFNRAGISRRKTVNTTFYTSWATGSLQFEQTTVRVFSEFIEQKYDVDVQILDPSIMDIKIDGTIYFKSLEELVRSVATVVKFPVYQSGDKQILYFGNKTENTNMKQ